MMPYWRQTCNSAIHVMLFWHDFIQSHAFSFLFFFQCLITIPTRSSFFPRGCLLLSISGSCIHGSSLTCTTFSVVHNLEKNASSFSLFLSLKHAGYEHIRIKFLHIVCNQIAHTYALCSQAYTPITHYLAWPCLPYNRDSYIRRIFLGTYAYIKVVKRHSATTHHTIIHQQWWMGEEELEGKREREKGDAD